jgi:hypothetical protein
MWYLLFDFVNDEVAEEADDAFSEDRVFSFGCGLLSFE